MDNLKAAIVITQIFQYTVLAIYLGCLFAIVIYSFVQLDLILTFWRKKNRREIPAALNRKEVLPFVTVQLPIYNELYVVERLLDAVAKLDYPLDRFEIQVLDDSDDDTVSIVANKVLELQGRGIQILHIRRPDRVGYKAGALAYGMETARGEYITIFDADFLPHPNYLQALLPYFTSDRVGVVQARWEHLNQHYSIFTEVQAFHLDAHFTIEQFSRDLGGYYLNFNGTAGIWRTTCIKDAGGWEVDTLTEDLDLSYRAQLKGWKFIYVDEVGAPAELPIEMGAIKSQQFRWMKGGAEVARKMLSRVWKSKIPFGKKIHASFHLLSSSVFILVLLLGTTSVPLLYIKHEIYKGRVDFLIVPVVLLFISFCILAVMYISTFLKREPTLAKGFTRFIINYIPFLSISMGLSLHNTIAVIEGYRGKKSPFVRTPKFDIVKKTEKIVDKRYISKKIKPSVYLELALFLYFCFGISMAFKFNDLSIVPFMLMQAFGFGIVGIYSFKHAWASR